MARLRAQLSDELFRPNSSSHRAHRRPRRGGPGPPASRVRAGGRPVHPHGSTAERRSFWRQPRPFWPCGRPVESRLSAARLWFLNFSTWRGVHGIYIEDLFVQPEHRGQGFGRALLTELARRMQPARLRPPRVGGAGLERAGHRLLHIARGGASRGMEDIPPK